MTKDAHHACMCRTINNNVHNTTSYLTATSKVPAYLPRVLGQVLDWLEDELELGEYRREFVKAKVDGALLLNLEVSDAWPLRSGKR